MKCELHIIGESKIKFIQNHIIDKDVYVLREFLSLSGFSQYQLDKTNKSFDETEKVRSPQKLFEREPFNISFNLKYHQDFICHFWYES